MSAILSSKVVLILAYRLPADLAQQEKSGIPWWFWVLMGATLMILFWMLFNRPKEKESEDIEEGPLEPDMPVEASQRSSAFEMEDDEIDFGPYAHEPEPSEAPTFPEASPSPFLDAVEEDATGPQGFNMDFLKADDFTIIEGIGPKIAKLLNQADIHTFKQLSNVDSGSMLVMLAAAGIFMTDPATWPDQARLAAGGQWDELKQLQESLKGGRRVS